MSDARIRVLLVVGALFSLGTACASSGTSPANDPWPGDPAGPGESATPLPTESVPSPAPTCIALLGENRLRRADLVRAVDQGLGQWLSGVGVTAVRQKGRFQGWRLDRLHPDDPCFLQVDLRPGDVVTRVNGASLEKPEQANQIFQGLRKAPRLQVERIRDGQPGTLSWEIVD